LTFLAKSYAASTLALICQEKGLEEALSSVHPHLPH